MKFAFWLFVFPLTQALLSFPTSTSSAAAEFLPAALYHQHGAACPTGSLRHCCCMALRARAQLALTARQPTKVTRLRFFLLFFLDTLHKQYYF